MLDTRDIGLRSAANGGANKATGQPSECKENCSLIIYLRGVSKPRHTSLIWKISITAEENTQMLNIPPLDTPHIPPLDTPRIPPLDTPHIPPLDTFLNFLQNLWS
jgi:hypothetical protein